MRLVGEPQRVLRLVEGPEPQAIDNVQVQFLVTCKTLLTPWWLNMSICDLNTPNDKKYFERVDAISIISPQRAHLKTRNRK